MKKGFAWLENFTAGEKILWCSSMALIILSFLLFDRGRYLTLSASVIGATSLIFNAKGNPVGQLLTIVFSLIYGFISYHTAYYGEMITYLGMTAPMALFALISWLRNPFRGNRSEVTVYRMKAGEVLIMLILTALVTWVFYYILQYFHTALLIPSTVSVTTSFLAVFLTYKRSPYFAIAYAANDIVLIYLWISAAAFDRSCFSVMTCFVIFLANDLYGFLNWMKIQKRQQAAA